MNEAAHHTFQVLTKRADRLLEMNDRLPWTDNIWMGVSVEIQTTLIVPNCWQKQMLEQNFYLSNPSLGPFQFCL